MLPCGSPIIRLAPLGCTRPRVPDCGGRPVAWLDCSAVRHLRPWPGASDSVRTIHYYGWYSSMIDRRTLLLLGGAVPWAAHTAARRTQVAIQGDRFLINGKPTYAG